MTDVTYRISITGWDGRYISCSDDLDNLGKWVIRTLSRMNAEHPVATWQPRITAFGEERFT